jgi:hypothetical protein
MKNQWIIHCVGASEEDQAHLRLLLRSARKHVSEDWVWGSESDADLLVIDGHSVIGDSANAALSNGLRASRPGVASAQVVDTDEPAPTGLFLRKPFHRDAFAAMLNLVARRDIAEPASDKRRDGDVEPDSAYVDPDQLNQGRLEAEHPGVRDNDPHRSTTLESENSGDPSPHPSARPIDAAPVAEIIANSDPDEPANESVAPVAAQAGPTGHDPQSTPRVENEPLPPSSKATEPSVDENARYSLLHYLPKRVLGGPARIALPDAPYLVIDPDARMFWADGLLPSLEPYAREPLRFGDWKHLDNAELQEARKGIATRPFAYLIWMDTFIHSRGTLSRRFDPDGTYSLSKRLDLSNDYPRALRISAQMSHPRRLDAIARASGADLAEVFDVVNAYEAIGYLEWTRHGTVPPRRA